MKHFAQAISVCTAAMLLMSSVVRVPQTATDGASVASAATIGIAANPINGSVQHNFTTDGLNSSYFDISGNLSTSKGTMTYNGQTLTQCLKMENATSISFTTTVACTITLVVQDGTTLYIDDVKTNIDASGNTVVSLNAGSHVIKKGNGTANLFYIDIAASGGTAGTTAATTPSSSTTTTTATTAMTTGGNGGSTIAPVAGAVYVAPNGSGSGASSSDPASLTSALSAAKAGTTIYCLAGTYQLKETINIAESQSGSKEKNITVSIAPGTSPSDAVFDFSALGTSDSNRGIVLQGSYWHFYGIKIQNAGDNGMLLCGDDNRIERCEFYNNQDTGLQISRYNGSYTQIAQWPTNNIILNCSSHDNCDDATMENADGFAAKLTCGEGNVFDGCMAYNNSDDGWDLYAKEATGPIGVVTLQNCIAFRNGFTADGRGYGGCDGNGFKLGGGGVGTRHIVQNCLAFENLNCGFTDNNNPGFGEITNCTAYNNGIGGNGKANYYVYRCSSDAALSGLITYYNTSRVSKTNAAGIKIANDKFKGKVSKSLYYNSKYYYSSDSFTADGTSPKVGEVVTPSDSDFVSLEVAAMGTDFHKTWRNADGSLKPNGFAEAQGTYASLGYHMASGYTPIVTPSGIPTESTPTTTTTTTTSSSAATTTTSTTTATTVTSSSAATTTTSSTTTTTVTSTSVTDVVYKLGDVNENGEVEIADAVLLARLVAEDPIVSVSQIGLINADVNTDGILTASDVSDILRFIAKLITEF